MLAHPIEQCATVFQEPHNFHTALYKYIDILLLFQFSGYLTTCLGDANNPGPDGICLLAILAGIGNIHSKLWIPSPQRNRKRNCAGFYSTYSQHVIC